MSEKKIDDANKHQEESEQGVSRRQLLKGAAAVGLTTMALGGVEKVEAKNKKQPKGEHNIADLIKRMSSDPQFAQEVINNPRKFQEDYNLSNGAVRSLKGLFLEDFMALATRAQDPGSFTAGAITVATMTRADFAVGGFEAGSISPMAQNQNQLGGGDSCYYFG
jgi:hypothetical protein